FGALAVGEVVCYQRPEWFHRHVKGSIHDHHEAAADPEGRDDTSESAGVGNQGKCEGREEGAGQEIGFASTQSVPGPVAVMPDQPLDDPPHNGSNQPEGGKLVDISPEGLKDA